MLLVLNRKNLTQIILHICFKMEKKVRNRMSFFKSNYILELYFHTPHYSWGHTFHFNGLELHLFLYTIVKEERNFSILNFLRWIVKYRQDCFLSSFASLHFHIMLSNFTFPCYYRELRATTSILAGMLGTYLNVLVGLVPLLLIWIAFAPLARFCFTKVSDRLSHFSKYFLY